MRCFVYAGAVVLQSMREILAIAVAKATNFATYAFAPRALHIDLQIFRCTNIRNRQNVLLIQTSYQYEDQ